MPAISQTAKVKSSVSFRSLPGAGSTPRLHTANMETEKNGGPNFLRAWRLHRGMTLEDLAAKVGTTAGVISLLETGERGLSAKWLRRLAPVFETTPGHLLDHDPTQVSADVVNIWTHASFRQKQQIVDIAKTIVSDRSD